VAADHVILLGPPITLAMSPNYTDGGLAIWTSVLGPSAAVAKIDHDTFTVVDTYVPVDEEPDPPPIPLGISGAYSLVDQNFHFILGRSTWIEVYRDSVPDDRFSEIELVKREFLPASAFCRSDDLLVGGVMLPDGTLAFATEQAVVGVIPSDLDQMTAANVQALPSENGADCTDMSIPSEDLETVSNSLAADEHGGFYVVTNAAVLKFQWDGATLQKAWRAEYASDPPFSLLRLGPGSGSTPSLMGTALDDDRFVVITDGQELMHLVLMWRDAIPPDWQPIAPGKDPRIACEIAVTFGDPAATRSLSEQSVLVRGHSAVVVNNLLTDESAAEFPVPALATALAALEGGNPEVAPKGIERFDWDPETRTCGSVWTNSELSIPNGIPTMSAAAGLMYGIGLRDGIWGLEGVDFATGESKLFVPSVQQPCSQEEIDQLAASPLGPILSPVVERLPGSCENSFFAATEVGPDGTVYTGTFQGASRFTPAAVLPLPSRQQSAAGLAQGIDLANRGLAALPADVERARDAVERGQVQLDATIAATADASGNGELDAGSAGAANAATAAARDHFGASEAALDTDVGLAQAELTAALADLTAALDSLTPCAPAPQSDCRPARASTLRLRVAADDTDKLVWKWKSGEVIDGSTLPDPTVQADYALCFYAGASPSRQAEARVPADPAKWRLPRHDRDGRWGSPDPHEGKHGRGTRPRQREG
jgi:hypothetical protein